MEENKELNEEITESTGTPDVEKLIMENRLYKAILDNTHAMIFWKDKDRRFVGANKAFLDYYGFESPDTLWEKSSESTSVPPTAAWQ